MPNYDDTKKQKKTNPRKLKKWIQTTTITLSLQIIKLLLLFQNKYHRFQYNIWHHILNNLTLFKMNINS